MGPEDEEECENGDWDEVQELAEERLRHTIATSDLCGEDLESAMGDEEL